MTISRSVLLTIGALAMMVPLSGCSPPTPLTTGDCIADPREAASASKVSQTSCETPHHGEIIGIYTATDGPFPGVDALSVEASATCQEYFETTVGVAASQSVYDLFPLTPSELSWNNDADREVLCVVRSSDGTLLKGSVAGTVR